MEWGDIHPLPNATKSGVGADPVVLGVRGVWCVESCGVDQGKQKEWAPLLPLSRLLGDFDFFAGLLCAYVCVCVFWENVITFSTTPTPLCAFALQRRGFAGPVVLSSVLSEHYQRFQRKVGA